jgi:hypothetical protein
MKKDNWWKANINIMEKNVEDRDFVKSFNEILK